MLGKAVCIRGVLADRQHGVIVENAAEHIACFTRYTGDYLSAVDAVLIGGVGIEGERSVVVAEVARIDAAKQAVALDHEALTIRG